MAKLALVKEPLPCVQILLVEDSPSDAFLAESLLAENSVVEYKIECVKTQAAALSILDKHHFDVCLLDLSLPDASGFSALIEIQEKAPDMPILILTGVNDTSLAKRAVGRGAQDYLLKDEMEITGVVRAIDYAMERKRAEKNLFQRANFDALTNLANREAFLSRLGLALARAERSDISIAVLFIDLDRFKPINDAHGHDAGDEALKAVAVRIKTALRSYDTPARLGGDEFAVLLEGIQNPRDAVNIAQKIIKALSTPISYHNLSLEVSASIGIAFSDPSIKAETLLQQADTAMYYAKKEGGSKYRFYAESMHEEALARLSLEEDLRKALESQELRLYYQPYVNPDGEIIFGVEALLRWNTDRGLLSANEFLPAAESARLMPKITEWMCTQLRRDLDIWNKHGIAPLCITINLSFSQLSDPHLLENVSPLTNKDCLGTHRLALEISEEIVSSLTEEHFITIGRITAMGIELHLDHFGRGSLSLTALHSLPFSLLKLDASLIKNMSKEPSGNVLLRAAIMLAHHMGIEVGAVGVETPWQAKTLKAHSCDMIQGFLTSQPLGAKQLADWLDSRKRK